MLRELLSIIRSVDPLREMSVSFAEMLGCARDLTLKAGDAFFEGAGMPEVCTWIGDQDVRINDQQMRIRRQVTAHLSENEGSPSLPYCLLLVSLIKDVERIGDYAKNLCEIRELLAGELPEDDLVAELREIRYGVEAAFSVLAEIFEDCDREQALELIRRGHEFARRCDMLVAKAARSTHDSGTTTAIVLGTRYYKRVGGHVLNLLSSVVMPLHKVDYYDKDLVAETGSS